MVIDDRAAARHTCPSTDSHTTRAVTAFRTPVRGSSFAARPPGAEDVVPGRRGQLVREPHNPADALAVAVWVGDDAAGRWRLGYLDRAVAARIAPMLDRGDQFVVEVEEAIDEPSGRWRRPVVALRPAGEPTRPRSEHHVEVHDESRWPEIARERAHPGGWTTRLVDRPPGTRRRVLRAVD